MCLWLCLRTFILFNVTIYYFTSFSKNDLVANEVAFIWFCRLVCKLKAIGEKLQALNKLKYSLPLFPVSIVNTSTHIQKCQKKMSLVKLFHGVCLFSGSSRTVMWTICNMVVKNRCIPQNLLFILIFGYLSCFLQMFQLEVLHICLPQPCHFLSQGRDLHQEQRLVMVKDH